MLEIGLLGRFDVRRRDLPISIRSRPARLLLALLAASDPAGGTRSWLAGTLWGEMPEDAARKALRQTLWRLRQALGPSALRISREAIGLAEEVRSDLGRLLSTDPEAPIEELIEVTSAYEGEFLPGVYDEWAVRERERARAAHDRLTENLLGKLADAERWGELQAGAERWISLGNVPESAYRHLMLAAANRDDQAGVAAAYERCLAAMRDEVGVEPSRETHAVYRRLSGAAHESARRSGAGGVGRGVLPVPSGPFIGRGKELGRLSALLAADDPRAIAIVAPGGAGKTRLALHLTSAQSAAFRDGVAFVPLVGVASTQSAISAIAAAIDLPLAERIETEPQLLDFLRHRRLLLVLDAFEHVVGGSRLLARIVGSGTPSRLLVTSRVRPSARHAISLQLGGLLTGGRSDAGPPGTFSDAAQLYAACVHRIDPLHSMQAEQLSIERLCRSVEGSPLAIELAASWTGTIGLDELLSRITHGLDALRSDDPALDPRHRSLHAVYRESLRLLSQAGREAVYRLAVFRSPFDAAAAAEVCGVSDGQLRELERRTLLRTDPLGGLRFHEVIGAFALADLERRTRLYEVISRRHAVHCLRLLDMAFARIRGPDAPGALSEASRQLADHRAALRWMARDGSMPAVATEALGDRQEELWQAMTSLYQLFLTRDLVPDGRDAFATLIGALGARRAPGLAGAWLEHAMTLHGAFLEGPERQTYNATAWHLLKARSPSGHVGLSVVTLLHRLLDDLAPDEALASARAAVRQARAPGNDPWVQGVVIGGAAHTILALSGPDEAVPLLEEARTILEGIGELYMRGIVLSRLAMVAVSSREPRRATPLFRAALDIVERLGDEAQGALLRIRLAEAEAQLGRTREAVALARTALRTLRRRGDEVQASQAASLLRQLDGTESASAVNGSAPAGTPRRGAAAS